MKKLILVSLTAVSLYGIMAQAQGKTALESIGTPPQPTATIQNYFTEENKVKEVARMQKVILDGCTIPVKTMPKLHEDELEYYVKHTKLVLEERFSKSFNENPLIKTMLFNSLDAVQADPSCYKDGNNCRERLLASAAYYYQKLRPNIPGCDGYVKYDYTTKEAKKKKAEDNGYVKQCETELLLRNQVLKNYGSSNGGMNQMGAYTDQLTAELNRTATDLATLILHTNTDIQYEKVKIDQNGKKVKVDKVSMLSKDRQRVDICEDVQSGVGFYMNLRSNVYGEPFGGFDPSKKVSKKPEPVPVVEKKPEPCVEEITVLYSDFVPVNFDEGSATLNKSKTKDAKKEEVNPVRAKIEAFISTRTNLVITDINVTSSSSKTPFYKKDGSYEKEYSDNENLKLANSRAEVARRILDVIKAQHAELSEAKFTSSGRISGPDFNPADTANRKILATNPKFKAEVEKLYAKNKDLLAEDATIKSVDDLLDAKRFTNLYEAKYKPFQGFKIEIKGYSKETRKCGDKEKAVDPAKKVEPKSNTTSGKSQN